MRMKSTASDTLINPVAVSRWVILGILLLAAFLRLYRLELISVTNVTAFQELTASSALSFEGWDWPLAGPPTEDIRSSAFLPTAIALAGVIWRHPFSGIVVVVVLNLCAVALVYRLCARQFGLPVAGIATLLYASSPWGVLYARLLVPASCLAVFTVLLVHLSLCWLEEKGKVQLTMMVVLAFAIPQIHFSGICAPIWLMVVLYPCRKQLSKLSLVCGGLLTAMLWAPWIAFQQITGWGELQTWVGQILQTPAAHGYAFLHSINHLQCLLHSSNFDYWFGESPSQWPDYFPAWQRWSLGVSAVVLLALLLGSVISVMTRTADRPVRLLLLWVVLPVLSGTLLRTGLSPENMLIAYPIPFVLVGVMTVHLQKMLPQRIRLLPLTAVLAICMVNVGFLASCARLVANGQVTSSGRYELSYHQRLAAIQSVLEDAGTGSVRLVGEFAGWNPAYAYVLSYSGANPATTLDPQNEMVCYWLDEQPPTDGLSEAAWKNQKERQINLSISQYLGTPPDWVIERYWYIEKSQVYRLRFMKKKPLQ
jgi:4-amino-4-deoxy-L-arabinose transferase-like glycosyltransferase